MKAWLLIISKELGKVEGNLENYQGNNQIVDMGTQTGQTLGNTEATTKSVQ